MDRLKLKKIAYYCVIFFLFACFIAFRRPDSISNPQFWAEDGKIWFADAYNNGLRALITPQDGYLQTLSRVTALGAQFFSITYAPLIFNLTAILVQTLPPFLLTTPRVKKYIPSLRLRILLIAIYLLLPNMGEMYINITNAYWYLALSAFILLSCKEKKVQLFDVGVIFLSGLSGPLSIFLAPIFLLSDLIDNGFFRKSKNITPQTILYCMTALVQICTLFNSRGIERVSVPARTSFSLLVDIIEKQIIWGSLAGLRGQVFIQKYLGSNAHAFYHLTTIIALGLVIIAFMKGPRIIRQCIAFSILVFISVLIINVSWADWSNSYELRYWLIPMLAFQSSLVWCLYYKNPTIIRITGGVFLSIFFFFCLRNYRFYEFFRYGPYLDLHYQEYAKTFEELPSGQTLTIPINPSGWEMRLRK